MVTTKQKPNKDSKKIKKGESEYTTIESYQFTKVERNRKKGNNGTTKEAESN